MDLGQWTVTGGFIFTLLNALLWCYLTMGFIYNYYKNPGRRAFGLVLLAFILALIELLSLLFLWPSFMSDQRYIVMAKEDYHLIQSLFLLTAALISILSYHAGEAGDNGSAKS